MPAWFVRGSAGEHPAAPSRQEQSRASGFWNGQRLKRNIIPGTGKFLSRGRTIIEIAHPEGGRANVDRGAIRQTGKSAADWACTAIQNDREDIANLHAGIKQAARECRSSKRDVTYGQPII